MQLPKTYEPKDYEGDIYALWEKAQAFTPTGKGRSYSIAIPPPNANGNLHLGHALTLGIQDIAIRYHRMLGDNVLFLPGADHAGFETQVVYEKQLAKEGKSRFDFSREELYQQVWDFVALNRTNFEGQIRRLGSSVDWSRYVFTLDEKIVTRAYATFKKMWDEGLIYRGERLVNFCTFHGTSFADIEVEHKEETGKLWYIRYPLTTGGGEVVVATTRPETMLGDTGVAVHPDDARFVKYVGKTVKLPLTGREVPVIADSFVDPQFGTGAVKLTPAHDPNDYDAAERHSLPRISVIDHEGHMTNVPEDYRGLTVLEARDAVVKALEAEGSIVKIEELTHSVGHCYKCGTIIEPLLKDQWFIDMDTLTKPAIKVLKDKKITFYPDTKRVQLIRYLENLKDWNISRQTAWGIPIPAFQNVDEPDDWIFDDRVDQEFVEVDSKTYHRDPDTFDTWFSSSSWAYATLNYGNEDDSDYKQFSPLSLMETGFDILNAWVSRMIMMSLYVTGNIPFERVYLHGLILDEHGQKMSKSKGNVINPMDIIDQYGSDALRMGVITGQTPGNNQPFGPPKVVAARNFCNKLWNMARYIEGALGSSYKPGSKPKAQTSADYWVLRKLQQSTDTIAGLLEDYRFSEAYDTLYHFVWDDVADWYIEVSKSQANREVLGYVLETILKIAHPFAPFVTETIWQTLYGETDKLLATTEWPKVAEISEGKAEEFEELKAIITETRTLVKTLGIAKPNLYYTDVPFLAENAELLTRMGSLADVREVSDGTGLLLANTRYRCWLDVDSGMLQAYADKLAAQIADVEKTVTSLQARLDNKGYVDKAPKEVVQQTKDQLDNAKIALERLQIEQTRFKAT